MDESIGALTALGLRSVAFLSLIFGEEMVFRRLSIDAWRQEFREQNHWLAHPILVSALVSVVYLGCKSLQFDLATMAEINLVLLSAGLTLTALRTRTPWKGAGGLCGFFLATSAVFGLPYLGSEGAGLFLLQYGGGASRTTALMTGGLGGVLSSAVLGAGLTLWIILEVRKTRFADRGKLG
jgi:hypothetical protein